MARRFLFDTIFDSINAGGSRVTNADNHRYTIGYNLDANAWYN